MQPFDTGVRKSCGTNNRTQISVSCIENATSYHLWQILMSNSTDFCESNIIPRPFPSYPVVPMVILNTRS